MELTYLTQGLSLTSARNGTGAAPGATLDGRRRRCGVQGETSVT